MPVGCSLLPGPTWTRQGIALMEVLIALAVFSLVALGLARVFTESMNTAHFSERQAEATEGLQNRIDLSLAQRISPGETDWPEDDSGLKFHLQVAPAPLVNKDLAPLPNLYEVRISVHWREDAQPFEREVTYLKYQTEEVR